MGRNYIPFVPKADDPWENLADQIIIQACADYRRVLSGVKITYEQWLRHNLLKDEAKNFRDYREYHNKRMAEKRSLERFFRSEWFGVLTICNGIDGEWLVRKLREEVNK